jgi:DNA-directed RNA polymerase subunit RPC12/RpoP
MRTKQIGCYRAIVTWGGHSENIVFTLPDSGYEIVLYSCLGCGARFAAEPEFVHHFGVSLEARTSRATCPECSASLADTLQCYPQKFLATDGTIGNFELPREYPPDDEHTTAEVWDLDSIGR